ncbi:MAG TPA: N-acetylmuramoyl-L-alanine amidase, partial [Anaerolineae bacterium]|nr:N-acetylmuramoyl-L-alanine amidase [Anaerolineae bacterium]
MVDEANRAWTQGVSEYNDEGIGVEHEVLATNLGMWDNTNMLREAGKLAADVCNRNLIPKQRRVNNGEKGIYGHSDVRATDCPNLTPDRWTALLQNIQGALPSVGTPLLYSIQSQPGSSHVTATWRANNEPTLLGYRLYYATSDDLTQWQLAADETMLPAGTTSITLNPSQFIVPPTEPVYHFRLSAIVPNGAEPVVESGFSDVYSRSWMGTGSKVLIVDGFDRISGSYKIASHHFATSYFRAMRDRGVVQVSTVANEKVEDGTFALSNYDIVVWFVGDESSVDVVFSANEKNQVINYLNAGGKMLISGSEIAYNVGRAAAAAYDLSFMNNYLKSTYVNDGSVSYTPATGILATDFDGLNIPFGIVYPEDFPDAISPMGGATAIMNYAVAPNIAGIAYKGTFGGGVNPGALLYLGFTLETASSISISAF